MSRKVSANGNARSEYEHAPTRRLWNCLSWSPAGVCAKEIIGRIALHAAVSAADFRTERRVRVMGFSGSVKLCSAQKKKLPTNDLPFEIQTSLAASLRRETCAEVNRSRRLIVCATALAVSHGTTYSCFAAHGYTIRACASHITEYRKKPWTWIGVIF